VVFSGATIEEALTFLRTKSRDLDTSSVEPKGVKILLREVEASTATISLDLKDVPLGDAVGYVAELGSLEMRVEPFAVVVAPKARRESRTVKAEAASPILLPQIEFREATLDEAIAFIRAKSREVDPDKKGVNILRKPGGKDAKLSLSLKQVPVNEALRYLAELSGHQLTVEGSVFILSPAK
jgi:type II secretory pathway component HofQ